MTGHASKHIHEYFPKNTTRPIHFPKSHGNKGKKRPRPSAEFTFSYKNLQKAITQESGQHNVINKDHIKIHLGDVCASHKHLIRHKIHHSYSKVVSQWSGQQYIGVVTDMGTRNQLTTVTPSVAYTQLIKADTWPTNPFDINPNAVQSGDALTSSLSPYQFVQQRAYLHDIYGQMSFTNFMNVACDCILMAVTPKQSQDLDCYNDYFNIVAHTGGNSAVGSSQVSGPTSVGVNPVTSNTWPKPGFDRPTNPGLLPTQMKDWDEKWKVLKTKHFTLAPGDTHKIQFDIAVNRMLYEEKVNTSPNYIKKQTVSWLLVARGAPVKITTNGSTADSDNSIVTYSNVDIGFLQDYFVTVSHSTKNNEQTRTLTDGFLYSAAPIATDTGAKIINDTDTAVNATVAI